MTKTNTTAPEKLKIALVKAREDQIEKLVTGSIIMRNDMFLLVKRVADDDMFGGLWEIPSGGVDAGETFVEGLVREQKEETGTDVLEVVEYVNSLDYLSGSGKKARQLNCIVRVDIHQPITLEPEEHNQYTWVSPKTDIRAEYSCSEGMYVMLEEIQRYLLNIS